GPSVKHTSAGAARARNRRQTRRARPPPAAGLTMYRRPFDLDNPAHPFGGAVGRALAKEDVGGFSSSTGKSYAGRQPGKRRSRAPSRKWSGMQTYARRMSQVVAGLLEGRRGLVLGVANKWSI